MKATGYSSVQTECFRGVDTSDESCVAVIVFDRNLPFGTDRLEHVFL